MDPAEVQKEMERKKVKVLSMESIDGSDDEQQQFQRTAKYTVHMTSEKEAD